MEPGKDYIMNKKVILRIAAVVSAVILVGNCVGCSNEQSPEKGNTSNEIVETIEIETIEIEERLR